MRTERIRLGNGVPDLRALGVRGADELFDAPDALRTRARAHGLSPPEPSATGIAATDGRTRIAFPLPGTAAPGAALPERPSGPGGPGTGWVVLERWTRPPLGALLYARLTSPRSASLAEREWNLYCHLRACGIGTPEPLAVGARGAGFAARASFLVTRALEGFLPLAAWWDAHPDAALRRRAALSLESAVDALARARVELPRLDAAGLWLPIAGVGELGDGACASPAPGLRANRLPSVVVASVEGGRLLDAPAERAARALRAKLAPFSGASLGASLGAAASRSGGGSR